MRDHLPIHLIALVLAGCGGTAVVEAGAGGAGATAASGTSSTTSTNASTGSGSTSCASHEDCGGGLCIFATGTCAARCGDDYCDACDAGSFCQPCATSSCPGCADCVAACTPLQAGQCDGNDPCPPGDVCIWTFGYCAPACGPNGECGDFSYCDSCASSSCCGCENCTPACVGGE